MRDNSGYQSFSTNFKMILRSGREKPYGVPPYRRGPMRRKFLPSTRSAAAENSGNFSLWVKGVFVILGCQSKVEIG